MENPSKFINFHLFYSQTRAGVHIHTHTPASRAKDILHCCEASEFQQVAQRKKGVEETSRDIHSTQDISIYPKMASYLQDDIR